MHRWGTKEAHLLYGSEGLTKGPSGAVVTPYELKELPGSSQGQVVELILWTILLENTAL